MSSSSSKRKNQASSSQKNKGFRKSIKHWTPTVYDQKYNPTCTEWCMRDMTCTSLKMAGLIPMEMMLTPQSMIDANVSENDTAIQHVSAPGFGLESITTYQHAGPARSNIESWSERNYQMEHYRLSDVKTITDVKEMKSVLMAHFGPSGSNYPCVGQLYMREFEDNIYSFRCATGKNLPHPRRVSPVTKNEDSHCLLIVCYDTTHEDPDHHFLEVKNSWGLEWGNKGFSKVALDAFDTLLVPTVVSYKE